VTPGRQAPSGEEGTVITTVWHLAGLPNATAQLLSFLGALVFLGFLMFLLWLDYRKISAELERYRGEK
jgi:hypothetical protein